MGELNISFNRFWYQFSTKVLKQFTQNINPKNNSYPVELNNKKIMNLFPTDLIF